MSTHYALVYGPHTRDEMFGADQIAIPGPDAVQDDDRGNLVITQAAREASVFRGREIPFRPARKVIYPKGAWHKVVVGEYPARRKER